MFLPIYYMVRLRRLTYTGNVFRAALIYMGFCYSRHTMGLCQKSLQYGSVTHFHFPDIISLCFVFCLCI